jgi:hypothetical protein
MSNVENRTPERRKEPRYYVGAPVVLRHARGEETYSAVTLNVSASGILLKLSGDQPFQIGDDVLCEVSLPGTPEQPLLSWGVGRVIRVDDHQAAIELEGGTFSQ